MLPLRDNIPTRRFPFVNYTLIVICVLVFFVQVSSKDGGRGIIERYGMVPARITNPEQAASFRVTEADSGRDIEIPLAPSAVPVLLTMVTCVFLHGGWMHLIGNMLFLHIFGDNVEDTFGHLGYLIFYLFTGVLAGLAHLITGPDSTIPTIGASGAIAGIMGGYMILYPHSKVLTLIPIIIFQIVVIPAWIFLGIWMIIQLVQGSYALGIAGGGVAWWAHVGGFVAGVAIAWLLKSIHWLYPLNKEILPHTDRMRSYRVRNGMSKFSRRR